MSGFSLDFNDTYEGFGKIEDGTYEVIIELVNEDATPSGAEHVDFRMVIRNDLDQPHQNQKIWHKVWKAKATGKYNMTFFNTIGKAAQLENGKVYNSLDELMQDYEGKPVQIFVQNETSEYNGKTYENLNVKSWNKTKFPDIQHEYKNNSQSQSGGNVFESQEGVVVEEDDLPF